jgi:hypothetical protein
MTRAHNQNAPDERLSPQEMQEWETVPEVQEINYHVPVVQINTPPSARNGIHFTVLASTTQNPVQLLLGRDYDRVKAYVTAIDYPIVLAESQQKAQNAFNAAMTSAGSVVSAQATNTATDPGAGGTVANISAATLVGIAPAGTIWTVNWQVSLQGTVTSADANNMSVVSNLSTKATALYPGVAGNYSQLPVQFAIPSGAGITIEAVAAASGASAVYGAQVVAYPTSVQQAVYASNTSGQYLPVGSAMPIEHCDEIWFAATSPNTGRIAVEVCRTERASA